MSVIVIPPSESWDNMQRVHNAASKIGYGAGIADKDQYALNFLKFVEDPKNAEELFHFSPEDCLNAYKESLIK